MQGNFQVWSMLSRRASEKSERAHTKSNLYIHLFSVSSCQQQRWSKDGRLSTRGIKQRRACLCVRMYILRGWWKHTHWGQKVSPFPTHRGTQVGSSNTVVSDLQNNRPQMQRQITILRNFMKITKIYTNTGPYKMLSVHLVSKKQKINTLCIIKILIKCTIKFNINVILHICSNLSNQKINHSGFCHVALVTEP